MHYITIEYKIKIKFIKKQCEQFLYPHAMIVLKGCNRKSVAVLFINSGQKK